ncbi:ABC transporter ATP-binding protein [Aquabacterium sp. J223]|uniref:ABC transporter ATP-binding protein n=1 Tax=Aquabacterium sp. J223 TaxID=2898431 RepID=UPI0021AD9729|nr:ABC transporter ATP-binding protein [Aquabacterium sp. J223]UUX94510.1 ABC transporter ATP-binding protein [Aquabacterium sp. J223]
MTAEVLQVRGLGKRFGALAVTRDVDLSLATGERLALIGPNGAGKTTLVNLITGVLAPDHGSVRLDGEDITRDRPEVRVRRGLVRTHQLNTLLPETPARENLAIAIAERERLAWRMLRYGAAWRRCLAEADAMLQRLGLHGVGQRSVRELAYGQQRLLEIGIALTLRPRVLLLDEPAAGVPTAEVGLIHRVLDELPPDIAILMIEHDMDLVFRFARRIVVLVQGGVLCAGTPAQIAADDRVRAVYLGQGVPA